MASWWPQRFVLGWPGTTSKDEIPPYMAITFPRGASGYHVLLAQVFPLVAQAGRVSANSLLITVEMKVKVNYKSKGF